jgi:hypothetical protein
VNFLGEQRLEEFQINGAALPRPPRKWSAFLQDFADLANNRAYISPDPFNVGEFQGTLTVTPEFRGALRDLIRSVGELESRQVLGGRAGCLVLDGKHLIGALVSLRHELNLIDSHQRVVGFLKQESLTSVRRLLRALRAAFPLATKE